jgi:hypothetical protein
LTGQVNLLRWKAATGMSRPAATAGREFWVVTLTAFHRNHLPAMIFV